MIIRETNRLNLDLSSLWAPAVTGERLTIRFKDLSIEKQSKLAERIKLTSPIYSIRKDTGPTMEKIKETLEIMNPIIFAEGNGYSNGNNGYKGFGANRHYSITGWLYYKLCRAIYTMTCIKRPLRRRDVQDIIGLTSQNYSLNNSFLDNNFTEPIIQETRTEHIDIPEIGLDDIRRVRERAERDGANSLPRGLSNPIGMNAGMAPIGALTDRGLNATIQGMRIGGIVPAQNQEDWNIQLTDETEVEVSWDRGPQDATIQVSF